MLEKTDKSLQDTGVVSIVATADQMTFSSATKAELATFALDQPEIDLKSSRYTYSPIRISLLAHDFIDISVRSKPPEFF